MDARLSIALTFPIALAACSSTPQPPAKTDVLEAFQLMIEEPALPDSIIRQADVVTYTVAPTESKPWGVRFDVSCTEPVGSMFYRNYLGMVPFTDNAKTKGLPQAQLQQLQRSEQLRNACAYRARPDWRAVDLTENQDWLVLDRNSAVYENGLLYIWTGRQLTHYRMTGRNTPIAQLQERLAIDCKQHSFKRLSHFMIHENGSMISGKIGSFDSMKDDDGQRRLVDAACKPDTWAKMATPPPRTPLMPVLEAPRLAPAIAAAINDLQLPAPRMTLHSLKYSYDTVMLNRIKVTDVKREDTLTRDEQSGQLLQQQNDSVIGNELKLTFRGLIVLGRRSFNPDSGEQVGDDMQMTDLSFKGDWLHLPEGGEVAYSITQGISREPYTHTVTCKVGTSTPASQVSPSLQGMAKPLTCDSSKAKKIVWNQTFNYLEDYGVFVMVDENTPLGHWTWRVDSAR